MSVDKDLTEVVFILDRSGSMTGLESDTIGGFNSFIADQKKEDGEARVTTVLFDDRYELLHDNVNINQICELTESDYTARGMTAMLDAIGKTINSVGERLSKTKESKRPHKVIVVIVTDGHENYSREFTKDQVKKMIEHQQDKYNWKFLFLGANIDSFSEAGGIGIDSHMVSNYSATTDGIRSAYSAVSKGVSAMRIGSTGELDSSWADEIL